MTDRPPITDDTRRQARHTPGSWVYSVDPRFDPDGEVPPYGIVGAWQADEAGELGEFVPNPNYRPLPEPTDAVDATMQRAATGRGTDKEFFDALVGSTVYLPAKEDGELVAYRDDDGDYVAVLTDPQQAMPTAPQLVPVAFADLLRTLPPEIDLWINPGGEVSLAASSSTLLEALEAREVEAQEVPTQEQIAPGVPEIPRKGTDRGDH
jgi:hypothetical protein